MNKELGTVAGVVGVRVATATASATATAAAGTATATVATVADIDTATAVVTATNVTNIDATATGHCVGIKSLSLSRLLIIPIVLIAPALVPVISLPRLYPMSPNILMIQLIHDDQADSNHPNVLVRPSRSGFVNRMQ